MVLNIVSVIISLFALASSAYVGIRQVKISELQAKFQNKVELFILAQPITYRDASGEKPDIVVPALYIRNIGGNVIYLDKYTYNGTEYLLNRHVLPPVSSFDGFRYIELPTNGTTHISFVIYFEDWQGNKWKTEGYADSQDGKWEVSYQPCVRQ